MHVGVALCVHNCYVRVIHMCTLCVCVCVCVCVCLHIYCNVFAVLQGLYVLWKPGIVYFICMHIFNGQEKIQLAFVVTNSVFSNMYIECSNPLVTL